LWLSFPKGARDRTPASLAVKSGKTRNRGDQLAGHGKIPAATLESGSLGHEERLGSRKAEGSHQSHVVGFGDCACTTVGSTLRNSIGSNNLFLPTQKPLLQIGMRVIDRYRGLKIENTDRRSRWRM